MTTQKDILSPHYLHDSMEDRMSIHVHVHYLHVNVHYLHVHVHVNVYTHVQVCVQPSVVSSTVDAH